MASGDQIEVTYYLNDVSDDLSQVLMTYNDDGVYDTAYTYGIERVGIDILDGTRPDAQNPLYYLYDGQGSVSYITKPDGEIRDTYKYDEFGKPKTGKLSPDGDKILHNEFGYTGEQWDEESKLQYLRARYYDPEIGRFINRDTYQGEVENPLSKNLYAYVNNNPVNNIDPTGNKAVSIVPVNPVYMCHVNASRGNWQPWMSAPPAQLRNGAPIYQYIELFNGFTPLGDIHDAISALRGKSVLTGEALNYKGRLMYGISAFIPIVSGKALLKATRLVKVGNKTVRLVKDTKSLKKVSKVVKTVTKGVSKVIPRVVLRRYGASELKKIGVQAEQKYNRAIKGSAQYAWKFFKAQVDKYSEVESGVFVGTREGLTFTYRAKSKSGPPTINIKGISGLSKIKFL